MNDDSNHEIISSRGDLLFYTAPDGNSRIECHLDGDSLWLSQAAMVELYQTSKANISIHLKNIFEEGELQEESVEALAKLPVTIA